MDDFKKWMAELEAEHLADLRFAEVARALRALSSAYVERRARLREGAALSGAGKRAAFALFYGPLHYLLVSAIVSALPGATSAMPETLVDLGCGTGAAGVAWASACSRRPRLLGIDRHPWAVQESAKAYRAFGLKARTERADLARMHLPKTRSAIVAAFTFNELPDTEREPLLAQLVERAARGDRVLIVEPLAGSAAPWWRSWRDVVERAGGRADEWRIRAPLPPLVEKLDRAAGLNHRQELTGRSLWIGS